MTKLHFLFLILFISVSCKQDKRKKVTVVKVNHFIQVFEKHVINDSISDYINPELGLFGFKFISDTLCMELKKIRIYYEALLSETLKIENA